MRQFILGVVVGLLGFILLVRLAMPAYSMEFYNCMNDEKTTAAIFSYDGQKGEFHTQCGGDTLYMSIVSV